MEHNISNCFDEHSRAVISCLCQEYQSVWIIDISSGYMKVYKSNDEQTIPETVDMATEIGIYEETRNWYIDNYTVEEHRDRLRSETLLAGVINNLAETDMYYVDYRRKNGEVVNYNQLVYSAIYDNEHRISHIMLGFRDIDSRKKAEKDELTGLYTRRAFIDYAEKRLTDNPETNYMLVISDIVDFKQVNEKYGIRMGDDILRWIGRELRGLIEGDMIVGRYGGDQFALMMSENTQIVFAKKHGFSIHPFKNTDFPKFTVKYGVYREMDRSLSVTTMCDYAHIALNSIKHDYSKQVAVYDEKLIDSLSSQRKIEDSMDEALRSEQFKVYYQPKHDASTGKLVGAEALIRWIHPEYGFMSPADFIPLFEQNGFVSEVDRYVFERTCKNIKKWLEQGIKAVPISVNASKMDFRKENLSGLLEGVASSHMIPRDLLHIEVTETLMEENVDNLIEQLTKMREYGYKIELDDFGSGYSSINILSQIPLDVIKLDMSFIKQIDNEKRKKVLEACISLAKNLGYDTVSEGVETEYQLETLRDLGVDIIQGYYYSKPLPEKEFEEYLMGA